MANIRHEIEITARDAATPVLEQTKRAIDDVTVAKNTLGKETDKLNTFIKAERAENKQQNFLFRESKDAIGAFALVLSTTNVLTKDATGSMKKMNDSLTSGFLAFQGLSFALNAIPYGNIISGVVGISVAILGLTDDTKESEAAIKKLSEALRGATTVQLRSELEEVNKQYRYTALLLEQERKKIDEQYDKSNDNPNQVRLAVIPDYRGLETLEKQFENLGNKKKALEDKIRSEAMTTYEIENALNRARQDVVVNGYAKEKQEATLYFNDLRTKAYDAYDAEKAGLKQKYDDGLISLQQYNDAVVSSLEKMNDRTTEIEGLRKTKLDQINADNVKKQQDEANRRYEILGNYASKVREVEASTENIIIETNKVRELSTITTIEARIEAENRYAKDVLENTRKIALAQIEKDAEAQKRAEQSKPVKERISNTQIDTNADALRAATNAKFNALIQQQDTTTEGLKTANARKTAQELTNIDTDVAQARIANSANVLLSTVTNEEQRATIQHQLALDQLQIEENAVIAVETNEDKKAAIHLLYIEKRKALEIELSNTQKRLAEENRKKVLETLNTTVTGAKKLYSIMSEFSQQGYDAEISRTETDRDSKLASLDAQIAAAGNNEQKKKILLAERAKVELEYEEKIKTGKRQAWEAERSAKLAMAMIDMAHAIIVALTGGPPPFNAALATITAIAAGAQVALIASQPVPKFAKGGQFIVPSGYEGDKYPMLVNSGERVTVETPSQMRQSEEHARDTVANKSMTVIINFNSPVPSGQWIKDSVQEGLRLTGLTVDKYFINTRKSIELA